MVHNRGEDVVVEAGQEPGTNRRWSRVGCLFGECKERGVRHRTNHVDDGVAQMAERIGHAAPHIQVTRVAHANDHHALALVRCWDERTGGAGKTKAIVVSLSGASIE